MTKPERNKTIINNAMKPTAERLLRNGGVIAEAIKHHPEGKAILTRYRAAAECILDDYLFKRKVSISQHAAGMKFRHAYCRAVLGIKVIDIGARSCHDPDMTFLTPLVSERHLNEAYAVLPTPQKAVVIAVCGHDEWAGGKKRLATLRRGLDRLAERWGVS